MFDRLVDLFITFIDLFRFWHVINECERGLILRLGRVNREIGPGIHWMWPFGVETVWWDNIVLATDRTPPQTLTSRDGVSFTVSAVIAWEIKDLRKLLLSAEGRESVMLNCASGVLAELGTAADWDALRTGRFAKRAARQVAKRALEYGIAVREVHLVDLTRCRPIRLIQDQT